MGRKNYVRELNKAVRDGMAEKGIHQADIAKKIGISRNRFCEKLKRGDFKLFELREIFRILEIGEKEVLKILLDC